MGAEIELKLDLSASSVALLENSDVLAGCSQARLISIYFDTPDLRLHKDRLVLRIRRNGRRLVQTVKRREGAAAGLFSRGEWEFPVHGLAPVVDERTPLAVALGSHAGMLRAVFEVEVNRTSKVVREGASRIEVVLDQGQARALDRSSDQRA